MPQLHSHESGLRIDTNGILQMIVYHRISSNQIWPSMAKYDQVRPSTGKYGHNGHVWPSIGQVWPSMVKYSQVSPSVAKYGQVWPSMVKYGQVLAKCGKVWLSTAMYGHICPSIGQVWTSMTNYWPSMTKYDMLAEGQCKSV